MNLPHPLRIPTSQVVIHSYDVNSLAFEGIQVRGQSRHQGFPLSCLHFGNLAIVKHHAANQLHVEMAHPQHPPRRLSHHRKGFSHNIV